MEVNAMENASLVVILWQDPIEYNGRYAVLVGGGGTGASDAKSDGNYDAFWNDATNLYSKLTGYGYLPNNIYLWRHFGVMLTILQILV